MHIVEEFINGMGINYITVVDDENIVNVSGYIRYAVFLYKTRIELAFYIL
jgi:hypothetical protein